MLFVRLVVVVGGGGGGILSCCSGLCQSTGAMAAFLQSPFVVAATVPAPSAYTVQRDEDREHPWASLKSRTKVPYPAVVHSISGEPRAAREPSSHSLPCHR